MRLPNWRGRLTAFTDAIRRSPFDWTGQHDCALGLAARAVEAMTGDDVGAPFRGRYKSEAGALRVLRSQGVADVADVVAGLLQEVPVSMAAEGDIVSFSDGGPFGSALGVVIGERVLVLRPEGLATMGLLDASRAFRVG